MVVSLDMTYTDELHDALVELVVAEAISQSENRTFNVVSVDAFAQVTDNLLVVDAIIDDTHQRKF